MRKKLILLKCSLKNVVESNNNKIASFSVYSMGKKPSTPCNSFVHTWTVQPPQKIPWAWAWALLGQSPLWSCPPPPPPLGGVCQGGCCLLHAGLGWMMNQLYSS